MSSAVSRIERISHELKKNPISRLYLLLVESPKGQYSCLINPTEWGFIYDGIINPPLRNILLQKDIYLEYLHTPEEYLAMTPEQRALSIAQKTFTSTESLDKYCLKHNIDIINIFKTTEPDSKNDSKIDSKTNNPA
jgi:hypothetical protein